MITGKSSFWMDVLMPCIKTLTMSHCSKNKMEPSEHVLYLLPESSALCLLLKKHFVLLAQQAAFHVHLPSD